MRLSLFILFILAFAQQATLIFAYWIVGTQPNAYLTWPALAIATQNPGTRWLSVALIGVVALAFSALTIISIGLLIAPLALALIVVSVVMLIRNRRPASADG